jgi:hypothetical protein
MGRSGREFVRERHSPASHYQAQLCTRRWRGRRRGSGKRRTGLLSIRHRRTAGSV